MLFALAMLCTADAGLTERAYERTVDLVHGLYLYPDQVDAHAMLREAADALASELHWLMVTSEGNAVYLEHGNGAVIGSVSVASIETLPGALLAVEQLVTEAGHPLGDVDVRLELLKGMTRALDRYSRILSGDGLDRFDVRLKGTLVGVGLNLSIVDDQLVVTRLNARGPAELGGVREGDRIVRIDGRSTVNMPTREATRLIRGEEGTQVVFTVLRDGVDVDLALTRAEIVVPNVTSRALEGGVGLVAITHVSQRTVENLLGELASLKAQGSLQNGLIVDLRGNTGGSMKESANAVDEFVDKGMLLRTAGPDGGTVKNLQARMDAVEGGSILDLPVVVLIDDRTASGAEILAGSLLELDRAVLVGTRSYGKGTVQKIYPIDDDTRLKLTVAQYLLEHDRVIAGDGIVPDVVIGEIELDGQGVHYEGWDAEHVRTPYDAIVPWVRERWGWRRQDVPERNVVEEIARRAVLDVKGPRREPLLAALRTHADAMRLEEEAHLVEALAAKGIDWSAAEAPPGVPPDVRVVVRSEPDPDREGVLRVVAAVENRGRVPLHRALVEVSSEFAVWDGVVLPIGRVDPGATVEGDLTVALQAGVNPREDVVSLALRADGRPPVPVGEAVLQAESPKAPRLSASLRLEGAGVSRVAVVELTNPSRTDVEGVEVHFGYPGDVDVELVDQASRIPSLPAGGTHRVELRVRPGPNAPSALPLQLVIETPTYGTLATWPLELPMDGSPVALEPPRIRATVHPLASTGRLALPLVVTDDGALQHVVVYRNGQKVAWAAGADQKVELTAKVELEPGQNRFLVVTRDEHGIEEREQFVVRGIPSDATVDAPDPGSEGARTP